MFRQKIAAKKLGSKERDCTWVAKKGNSRCYNKNDLQKTTRVTHCPIACGNASCSGVDSTERFKLVGDGYFAKDEKKMWKNCAWVSKFPKRCGLQGMKETCRATCNLY